MEEFFSHRLMDGERLCFTMIDRAQAYGHVASFYPGAVLIKDGPEKIILINYAHIIRVEIV